MRAPRELGYLARWQQEVEAGARSVSDHDALWRAACWEFAALEHPVGSYTWRDCLARAEEIMRLAQAGEAA